MILKASAANGSSALARRVTSLPSRSTFVRVYSGTLKSGSHVQNSTQDRRERVGRLLKMHANKREEIDALVVGDIGAVVGLKKVFTGDTLCAEDAPVILESIDFPDPVIEIVIEPKTKADQEKLGAALARLERPRWTCRRLLAWISRATK